MKRAGTYLAAFMLLLTSGAIIAQRSAGVHAMKTLYQDAQSWPATGPGVKLKNYQPFRAVYERAYSQGSGPNRGDLRVDRVVIHSEEVGWDGHKAALINLFDTGESKWSDTNGRSLSMYADMDTLGVLFEIGPVPGKAKDYYIMNVLPDVVAGTMVTTAESSSKPHRIDINSPGFGPGPWVLGSMDLKKDMKIRLDPFYSPGANILGTRAGRVIGEREFTDLSGNRHKAWVIESGGNLSSPTATHTYVIDRPPYLLARFGVNLDTKKELRGARLKHFQLLK